jgi:hypothetical protein
MIRKTNVVTVMPTIRPKSNALVELLLDVELVSESSFPEFPLFVNGVGRV